MDGVKSVTWFGGMLILMALCTTPLQFVLVRLLQGLFVVLLMRQVRLRVQRRQLKIVARY